MLDTAPSPILVPQMAQQPIMTLLHHFSTALSSWLSDAYGLVQTGVDKTGKHRIPQLYLQNGGIYSTDLYPDHRMKALCFFEYEGPSTLNFDDPLNRSGEWTHNLAAVVWLNLCAIDPNRRYDFSDELADDFLTRGLLASPLGYRVVPAGIERRNERIFQRYNFPQERQQLLMHPYAGFRIPFTVTQPYVACALPFMPAPPLPDTTAPIIVTVSGNIPLGSLVAYNQMAGTVLYDATKPPDTQTLYGISTTSGATGSQVSVQGLGLVHIDGWGLIPGQTYLAGPAGKLVTSNDGLYFSQTVGRAVTADDFQLDPQDAVILIQP